MPQWLSTRDQNFEQQFRAFLATKREVSEDVDATVREIIAGVRARGDEALIAYTEAFDRLTLTPGGIRVTAGGGH